MKKVPVTERALMARINRVLAKEQQCLNRCREDSRSFRDLGRYYKVDLYRNQIIDMQVDLEAFGRELGALKAHEALAEG